MISIEDHRERFTESREMASTTYSTLSEEQRETDKRPGLFDATMQPVVKLLRIGMCCFTAVIEINQPPSGKFVFDPCNV